MGEGLKRARAAAQRKCGEPKLTAPQAEFLAEVRQRSPRRVVAGYKPAVRLRELGLIVIEEHEGSYAWQCSPAPSPDDCGAGEWP